MRAVKGRIFGSMKTCGFSKNTQSRFASDFLVSVLWNFVPRLTHRTVFLRPVQFFGKMPGTLLGTLGQKVSAYQFLSNLDNV